MNPDEFENWLTESGLITRTPLDIATRAIAMRAWNAAITRAHSALGAHYEVDRSGDGWSAYAVAAEAVRQLKTYEGTVTP